MQETRLAHTKSFWFPMQYQDFKKILLMNIYPRKKWGLYDLFQFFIRWGFFPDALEVLSTFLKFSYFSQDIFFQALHIYFKLIFKNSRYPKIEVGLYACIWSNAFTQCFTDMQCMWLCNGCMYTQYLVYSVQSLFTQYKESLLMLCWHFPDLFCHQLAH